MKKVKKILISAHARETAKYMKKGTMVMIDLHTHILPGLDDGLEHLEMSLSMAKVARQTGNRKAIRIKNSKKPYTLPVLKNDEPIEEAIEFNMLPLW